MKQPRYLTNAQRWSAIVRHDACADGQFYYSVRTTGVYCRPSCRSRLPRPENVKFFSSQAEAEQAGFRSCKRCQPNGAAVPEQYAAKVASACRKIEAAHRIPNLGTLAKSVGLSPFHFHRLFTRMVGLTPKRYADAHRAERFRRDLPMRPTVTEAIYDAGFGSNSRFYEKANEMLGMRPTIYRDGGSGTTIRFAIGRCSLGKILVAASERGVCAIFLGDDAKQLTHSLRRTFPQATLLAGDKEFRRMILDVVAFVEQPQGKWTLPLDIRGTAFQQKVWQALRAIPPGETVSYSEIAQRLKMPKATRAVAQACAANKISIAIPCHRVLRNDGAISGYRWGVKRKLALLRRENVTVK